MIIEFRSANTSYTVYRVVIFVGRIIEVQYS